MWVVKLGGSLARSNHLPLWLAALAETGAIVAPGGGPFADAAREAQARWRFDDRAAHHMAILGMRQYGLMLAGMNSRLLPAETDDLSARPGQAKVWLPRPEELDQAGIPASWEVTSDSLAAWLAGRIGATHLLLVKSVDLKSQATARNFDRLTKLGWIDPVFSHYASNGSFRCWICGPDEHEKLAASLAEPERHFARIQ